MKKKKYFNFDKDEAKKITFDDVISVEDVAQIKSGLTNKQYNEVVCRYVFVLKMHQREILKQIIEDL